MYNPFKTAEPTGRYRVTMDKDGDYCVSSEWSDGKWLVVTYCSTEAPALKRAEDMAAAFKRMTNYEPKVFG